MAARACRLSWDIEYDPAVIKTFADVVATEFNTSVVEGKCELLVSFLLLVRRFGASDM